MKKDMPLEGLRSSRDSGSALYDTPQTAVLGRAGGVKLGNYVTISYGVTILTSGLESKDYPVTCNCKNRKHLVAPVAIGDGVWLCANVTVTPGITIAPKIIVAAGSVVTKDLDKEGWLYGGVPAKPIKPLNK